MENGMRFIGNNLNFVRKMRGYSSTQLAEEMGVSQSLVSKWEKNNISPQFEQLEGISNILKIPKQYFYFDQEGINEIVDNKQTVFFRKKAAIPKRIMNKVQNQAIMYAQVEHVISGKLGLPYFKIPEMMKVPNDINSFEPTSFAEVEELVDKIKQYLNIGNGPINNISKLVEKLGIRVILDDFEAPGVDAFTFNIKDRYYIALNNDGRSSVRIRLDALHELGHILLHFRYKKNVINDSDNKRRMENEAQYFASYFLISDENLGYELLSGVNLNNIMHIKKKWKISMQSILFRSYNSDYISKVRYISLLQEMSRNNWRKKEPYDDEISTEYPSYIDAALRYNKVSLDFFSSDFRKRGLIYKVHWFNSTINHEEPIMKIL